MPNQQIEHGTPTRLSTISSLLASRKLRVAGRRVLLHDDSTSSIIMIHDGEDALFVDISLCLSTSKASLWLREGRSTVMVLGYLELTNKPLSIPEVHVHAPPVDVNPRLVLRAIVVEEARDLDLDLWNRAIQAQENASTLKRNRDRETQRTEYAV
ncbi:hypothetical protein BD310DRAFT_806683 [Dichomitus squalens]|uniref:CST complex subunit Stn1 N-terminal domain-containing protein n=1 Tax=Dichomitus squalens TaxID=114155 RepID=A0A4Q9QA53_9APHY|nr:hypothetical protein BD310DRAFT_806683 [Dichomitus squalens]